MSSEIHTLDSIKQVIVPVLKSFDIKEARIFGSYAKGCATKYSDVDIYVNSGLRGLYFFGLLEDLVNALSVEVDLVDKQTLFPNGPLYQEIMRTGIDVFAVGFS